MSEESELYRPLESTEQDTTSLLPSAPKLETFDELNESTSQDLCVDESAEQLKITDIGIDCLEKVFEFLDLYDLLNVADSSKEFKSCADFIFTSKYGHSFLLSTLGKFRNTSGPNFKTILQLLRCFGHLITHIDIFQLSFMIKKSEQIIDYLNRYCAQSATHVEVHGFAGRTLPFMELVENHLKPFPNVKTVRFGSPLLHDDFLVRCFPNVEYLHCIGCNGRNPVSDISDIFGSNHYPRMIRLKLIYEIGLNPGSIPVFEHLEATLRLNPQLQHLDLDYFRYIPNHFFPNFNFMQVLQKASEYLTQLLSMSFSGCIDAMLNFDGGAVHFGSLKQLKMAIDCEWHSENHLDFGFRLPKIPLICDKLEVLTITLQRHNIDEFYSFIEKHPLIKTLEIKTAKVRINVPDGRIDKLRVAAALPLLNEFTLTFHVSTIEDVNSYLTEFKSLEKFSFNFIYTEDSYYKLRRQLKEGWTVSPKRIQKYAARRSEDLVMFMQAVKTTSP